LTIAPARNAENRLQADPLGKRNEDREQEERPADTNLGCRVLQAQQRRRDTRRPLGTEVGDADREHEQPEQAEQQQLHAEPAGFPREEERQQDDGRDLGDRGACHDELAKRCTDLTRVLQDWNHNPQRGGGQGDAEKKWRFDQPDCVQANTDQQRDSERDRVPECGEAEQATAKALVLDFETCEQKQKGEPE
jgi:hypothetical protein